jgi:hypothetical protein
VYTLASMLQQRRLRTVALGLLISVGLGACGNYRLVRPDDFQMPSYEPREVVIPAACDALIQRAATDGLTRFNDAEARTLNFCQQQHIIRAQEEEAAARRLEAHAEAASLALRATTVVLGAIFAVLTWVF